MRSKYKWRQQQEHQGKEAAVNRKAANEAAIPLSQLSKGREKKHNREKKKEAGQQHRTRSVPVLGVQFGPDFRKMIPTKLIIRTHSRLRSIEIQISTGSLYKFKIIFTPLTTQRPIK